MICDGKPGTLKEALEAYEEVLQSEDGEELKAEMKQGMSLCDRTGTYLYLFCRCGKK